MRRLVVVLALVLVAVVVASRVTLPYYALVPGQAQAVSKLITVPAGHRSTLHGSLFMTDVGVEPVHAINWIPDLLDGNVQLVKTQDLTGNLPIAQYDAEATVDMEESEMSAEAVALRQLGYAVPERDAGVTAYVIDPGSPASRVLQVGDVITAIDGVPTPDPVTLQTVLRTHQPGDEVTIQVGSITTPDPGRPVTVRLASIVEGGVTVPFLGLGDPSVPIEPMGTQPAYDFPFPVTINPGPIGGPSAGLAFTLGIIDSLSGGRLTGGRSVAATGTIRPDGSVGIVGGVPQKTIAVGRAGATIFLVPTSEAASARAKAGPGLDVIGVSSLHDALIALERHGGSLGTAATGPPPGPGGSAVPSGWQQSPWS